MSSKEHDDLISDNRAFYKTLSKDELIQLLLVSDSHLYHLRKFIREDDEDNGQQ